MSSRRIVYEKCALPLKPMHPEDVAMGFKRRRVWLEHSKAPDGHGVTTIEGGKSTFLPMRALGCDLCGETIEDDSRALAETMWNSNREGEPDNWESGYQRK